MITRTRVGIALVVALVLAACGGTTGEGAATSTTRGASPSTSGDAPSSAPPTTGERPAGTSPLPAVTVRDVATGETVALAELLPADRPLLVWFGAPH